MTTDAVLKQVPEDWDSVVRLGAEIRKSGHENHFKDHEIMSRFFDHQLTPTMLASVRLCFHLHALTTLGLQTYMLRDLTGNLTPKQYIPPLVRSMLVELMKDAELTSGSDSMPTLIVKLQEWLLSSSQYVAHVFC